MGSLNNSHHELSGGVCIFNGELILLYCDGVNCEVDGHGSSKGKLYLTTHRLIFTSMPLNQNPSLKSFSAPFYAMFDLNLEQPIFGANYIKGKVRGEQNKPNFQFKLKFNKGGAIELGQAMSNAAKVATQAARQMQFQPPPPYTPTASAYYQAPNDVFQPGYPIGFVLPTNLYPEAPPPGFIYTTQAPPPYPGLTTIGSQQQNMYSNGGFTGYPAPPQQSPYPSATGYAPQYQPQPGFQAAQSGYPQPQAGAAYPSAPEFPPTYDEATKKEK